MSWVEWLPLGPLVLYLFAFLLFLVWPVRIELEYGLSGLTGRFRVTLLIWPRLRFQLVAPSLKPAVEADRLGVEAELKMKSGWGDPSSKGEVKEVVTPEELKAIKRLPIGTFMRRWLDTVLALLFGRHVRHPAQHPLSWISISSVFGKATQKAIRVCERLEVNVRLGLHDAAYTAVGSGLVWGLNGVLFGLVNRRLHFLNPPRFVVTPDFRQSGFELGLFCILQVDKGQILIESARILLTRLKGALTGGGRSASH